MPDTQFQPFFLSYFLCNFYLPSSNFSKKFFREHWLHQDKLYFGPYWITNKDSIQKNGLKDKVQQENKDEGIKSSYDSYVDDEFDNSSKKSQPE